MKQTRLINGLAVRALTAGAVILQLIGCQPSQQHTYEIKVCTSPSGRFSGSCGHVGADRNGVLRLINGEGSATYVVDRGSNVVVDLQLESAAGTLQAQIFRDGASVSQGVAGAGLGSVHLTAD